MSAPNTNIEKQQRRHRPALIGISVAAAFAALVFLLNIGSGVDDDETSLVDEAANAITEEPRSDN
ncbi:MAG: hypothetical protein ACU0GG_04620 [Paracoccaceae bacterium]